MATISAAPQFPERSVDALRLLGVRVVAGDDQVIGSDGAGDVCGAPCPQALLSSTTRAGQATVDQEPSLPKRQQSTGRITLRLHQPLNSKGAPRLPLQAGLLSCASVVPEDKG